MDADRVKGSVKEGVGSVEGGFGDVTNNPDTEARGKGKVVEGRLQKGWGKAKDTARGIGDRLTRRR